MEPTVSDPHDYDPELERLLGFALNPGTVVLSERVKDTIPELSGVATLFLEAVGVIDAEKHSNKVANAEKHFQAVHEFWMHKDFVPLLYEVSDNGFVHFLGSSEVYARDTNFRLQLKRVRFIRKDSTLNAILNETDPSLRLRAAISILIRYWCMENMLEEYVFSNIGLLALGLDISFAAAQEAPLFSEGEKEMFFGLPEKRAAGPTTLAPESKRSRPTTMSTLNEFSPIGQLVNVPSIQRLAQDVSQHPKLVELAGKLLSSLEDAEYEQEPSSGRKKHYLIHCEAMWDFWWNQDFCVLMREHLLMDPHLFVMVKMFSDRFKREITMDLLQHIHTALLPKLETFLELGGLDLGKPDDRIRCAYSIMMRYWACIGVAVRLREQWECKPVTKDGRPLTKYDADCKYQKDEQIGEVLHYPVHNDDPADCVLTRWYEANETEINHLLDKEWRDVLTRRYSRDETETKSLLGKIGFDYTRLNVVLKNVGDGKLCMTCTKLTPVACTI